MFLMARDNTQKAKNVNVHRRETHETVATRGKFLVVIT